MAAEHSDAKSIQQTGEPCDLKIYNDDFLYGLQKIRISGLQEKNSVQKVESVKWSDIGGLEEVKVGLFGFLISKKDKLDKSKAVATESSANFIPVSIPDLIKGELELDQLDSVDQGVVVLSATNNPRAIDPSLLRPGRIDRLVYIKPPSFSERISILQIQNVKMKFSKSVNLREIAEKTENFTGADLKALVQRAALLRFKKYKAGERQLNLDVEVLNSDLLEALSKSSPSINLSQLD
ncbi:1866_t:CDS:2, partial [Racocetra fulgida]